MKYVALLRGINVGGKNKISMADLKTCFENLGYQEVSTYINSGNVLFTSDKSDDFLSHEIEDTLLTKFKFDSEIIKTLVISEPKLKSVIRSAPEGFGSEPEKYYSDVIFLIGSTSSEVFPQIDVNPAVDNVWRGDGVIYYQRLSAQLTKSRLSKIVGKPVYKSITIRTWNTVNKLYQRLADITK